MNKIKFALFFLITVFFIIRGIQGAETIGESQAENSLKEIKRYHSAMGISIQKFSHFKKNGEKDIYKYPFATGFMLQGGFKLLPSLDIFAEFEFNQASLSSPVISETFQTKLTKFDSLLGLRYIFTRFYPHTISLEGALLPYTMARYDTLNQYAKEKERKESFRLSGNGWSSSIRYDWFFNDDFSLLGRLGYKEYRYNENKDYIYKESSPVLVRQAALGFIIGIAVHL